MGRCTFDTSIRLWLFPRFHIRISVIFRFYPTLGITMYQVNKLTQNTGKMILGVYPRTDNILTIEYEQFPWSCNVHFRRGTQRFRQVFLQQNLQFSSLLCGLVDLACSLNDDFISTASATEQPSVIAIVLPTPFMWPLASRLKYYDRRCVVI